MGDNGSAPDLSSRLLRLVIVGHVDHGKSTLVGRLLSDTGSLPDGKLDFVRDICKQQGKEFEFAFLLDALEEEQEQGITIDTSQIFFSTTQRKYVIIDAPGHKEFLKNMVTGAADAEAALLLIDANEGVQEQSRRHGYILKLLGLTQVAVVINKMDLVGYDEKVYNNIKSEYTAFLNSLGVEAREFIPVSAKLGVNIAASKDEMSWYKGPTVLDMVDQFEKKPPPDHLPFRFPVQDVYKFDERRIIAGRIESGKLKTGDRVIFSPSNKQAVVNSIEAWSVPEQPSSATSSESIGFTLDEQIFVERGDVCTLMDQLPIVSTTFDANVFWMGKRNLEKGRKFTLKLNTQEVECEVLEFKKAIDASTLETLTDQNYIAKNDVAELTLKTRNPVAFDLFGSVATTGRFVLVDGYDVCGGGIITTYTPTTKTDKLRDEVRTRDFNWVKSEIKPEERAYRNGHRAALLLITGDPGVGKGPLARTLEHSLFQNNFQSYLLDRRNVNLGVGADLDDPKSTGESESARRLGEVSKLFLDAGHVVISTSNAFHRDDQADLRLLANPYPVVEIQISSQSSGDPDLVLSEEEAQDADKASHKIQDFLKEKKILMGHNYSI
ncbi:MAG: GTP-binding protein [Nitrospina sp.]|nr:GTP-binding protein [Nitrospina sp.]MBT3414343.1 GTP-binding protein [Nitrospina sp.]MBT3855709.1 GTP-binding protein [Nitrospina sp.]MBT4104492.1 GTP-binding protein [Nitrospina sp.]MBT4388374.1 GTP-binding protein [Nitrospina sp.]